MKRIHSRHFYVIFLFLPLGACTDVNPQVGVLRGLRPPSSTSSNTSSQEILVGGGVQTGTGLVMKAKLHGLNQQTASNASYTIKGRILK